MTFSDLSIDTYVLYSYHYDDIDSYCISHIIDSIEDAQVIDLLSSIDKRWITSVRTMSSDPRAVVIATGNSVEELLNQYPEYFI